MGKMEAHSSLSTRVYQEIQKMLAQGVIVPSCSPLRSPMVKVSKTDESLQICIDFRKANKIVRFDAFPVPQVEELLERIGQARYVSTIDLFKGYWQMPMAGKDQQKTAFGMPWGLFEFMRMMFSLHGAAVMFRCLMDHILTPHMIYMPLI